LMSSTASAPPEIYTLSLHRRSSDLLGALPEGVGTRIVIRITANVNRSSPANDAPEGPRGFGWPESRRSRPGWRGRGGGKINQTGDRKSTRLNSSHVKISYAVFCLKK